MHAILRAESAPSSPPKTRKDNSPLLDLCHRQPGVGNVCHALKQRNRQFTSSRSPCRVAFGTPESWVKVERCRQMLSDPIDCEKLSCRAVDTAPVLLSETVVSNGISQRRTHWLYTMEWNVGPLQAGVVWSEITMELPLLFHSKQQYQLHDDRTRLRGEL